MSLTHQHGHSLDLVLLHSFSLCDLKVCENWFSDHETVMFTVPCESNASNPIAYARRFQLITSTTRNAFSLAFWEANLSLDDSQSDLRAEELLSKFKSISAYILDSVTPLKTSQPKSSSELWIDDTIHSGRPAKEQSVNGKKKEEKTLGLFWNA